ncbi:MAG: GIY-YIG nuclease family protein [Candidatus Paceibacterota bacterium]|jgi:putative endonuclease
MFYVYVIKSKKFDNLYIGSTNSLRERLIKHNKGLVKSTKKNKPYVLIYYEAYKIESDARRREKMLKYRGQARNQLKLRIKDTLAQNES